MGYFIHVLCDNSWQFPRRTVSGRRARDAFWKYTGGDLRAAVEGVAEKMAAGSWKPTAEIFQSGSVSKETGAHNWAQIVPRR